MKYFVEQPTHITEINREIKRIWPSIQLKWGKGYYYIIGTNPAMQLKLAALYTTSIMVGNVKQLTMQQWMDAIESVLLDEQRTASERKPIFPKDKPTDDELLKWKVHTPNMLQELGMNKEISILFKPLQMLGMLLHQVGERAAQLNDPELNKLMIRLTIYSIADPHSPDYDIEACEKILRNEI